VFRLHVLNPFLDDSITDSRSEPGWRRPLWEALWQLVRKENSRGEAAQKVRRLLYERVSITKEPQGGFLIAWGAGQGSREEFERLTVAALRAVGIPARVETDGMAAWFEGAEWRRFSEIDAIHQVLSAP
jgi:transglutaminase-like putative cysteine protease